MNHWELSLVLPWPSLFLPFLQFCADLNLSGHSQLFAPSVFTSSAADPDSQRAKEENARHKMKGLRPYEFSSQGPSGSSPDSLAFAPRLLPPSSAHRVLLSSGACTPSFFLFLELCSVMFLDHLWLQVSCCSHSSWSCLPNSQPAFRFYCKDYFLLKALFDSQIRFTFPWGSDPLLWQ